MKLKTLLKNAISLLLTLIVVSSILDFIRKPNIPPEINATALYDLQGNAFFLPQLDQAKPTIIYFWGSWCGYCRYTSPAINSLSEEGYPVVSVALRSGTNKDVEDYLQTHHYQFTTVNDPQGKIADQWQVNVTPTIIILNKGKMARRYLIGFEVGSSSVFHRVFWLSGTKSITIHRLILKRTEL